MPPMSTVMYANGTHIDVMLATIDDPVDCPAGAEVRRQQTKR